MHNRVSETEIGPSRALPLLNAEKLHHEISYLFLRDIISRSGDIKHDVAELSRARRVRDAEMRLCFWRTQNDDFTSDRL